MPEQEYQKGWEGARLAIYKTSAYAPIACITSRSEGNSTNTKEKTNVCTEGKTVTKAISVSRTVSIEGEIVDLNSYHDLQAAQDSLEEQTFRIYKGAGTENPLYFKGVIMNLDSDYPADDDATFSMEININGEYLTIDPKIGG